MPLSASAEFAVNSLTAQSQTAPAVATFADGSFIVVWGTSDPTQDGMGYAIKAQRFDAAGNKIGTESLVNALSEGDQAIAQVAVLPSGGYVVTWTTQGTQTHVDARVFDAAGNPLGTEFMVNDPSASRQDTSQITVLDNGNFVIAWTDWNGFNMAAKIYASDGTPMGSQIRLNAVNTANEEYGDVAALEGGGFVATWRATDPARDGNGQAVIARVFDSSGNGGAEFVVNTATVGNQYSPSVTGLANGTFVVTWQTSDAAQDGSSSAIKAQLFDASGAKIGAEFLVNAQTVNGQQAPTVAALPTGGFLIVWETLDSAQDGSGMAVKGRYFDSSGTPTSPEFLVNAQGANSQFLPDIAVQPDGSVVAVWATAVTSFDNDIHARIFDFNASPVIHSDGAGPSASLSVLEGTLLATTVAASDAEGQPLSYAIVGGADAGLFVIDPQTGVLKFANTPDFEHPTDQGANNVYDVVVSASDGVSTDTQAIAVSIGNVDEPVVITSNGGGASAAILVEEGSVGVSNVAASDPEGASVTYAISGGADAAHFAIDAATGEIHFIEAPDFEAPADQDGDNVYEVTVSAQDSSSLDTQALFVTVTDVNERPIVNGGTSVVLTLPENGTAVTTVTASDPDGGAIVYGLEGDDAALFVIDQQTGALSFASAPDFEAPQDVGNDNFYSVRVTASDGHLSAFQTVQISIANVNEGVTISSGSSFSADENTAIVGSVTASDADGDAISYSLSGGADAALFALDSQTGLLSFVNAPDFESPADANGDNVYELIVTASDGSLLDTQVLSVAVNNLRDGLNLLGTGKADTLLGSVAEDSISGLAGNDKLYGYAGSDFLDGGDGNDRITGGTGADTLTGGAGADTFIYSALNDSSASRMDTITDFSRTQRDTISLAGIDANSAVDGDQAFTFVGPAAFSHRAGELRSYQSEGHTYVSGDVDGDGIGDFLIGLTSPVVLASGDFVL